MASLTSNEELCIGIIGAGARARDVYTNIAKAVNGQARIACFFDTSDRVESLVRELPGGLNARRLDSFQSVIDDHAVGAVMVGTPNAFHAEPAIHAMNGGEPLYLEKPLAATLDDHKRLLQAQRRTGARVSLGFVLRYTPFYRKLKEIVSSGQLGRIMFVQAVELMGIGLTADCYLRGWRAYRQCAGPLLLEKCCHDIDIVNWLLQVPCESVSAISDRTVFVPRGDRPDRCRVCSDAECPYRFAGTSAERATDERGQQLYVSDLNDYCIYNRPHDIADHTTLLARYAGGVHVSFNVTMGVARGCRRIRIVGSRGQISGCAEDNALVFEPLRDGAKPETIVLPAPGAGGHYGGDAVLAGEFVRLVRDPGYACDAGIAAGFESGIVCLAADESSERGAPVDVASYRA